MSTTDALWCFGLGAGVGLAVLLACLLIGVFRDGA